MKKRKKPKNGYRNEKRYLFLFCFAFFSQHSTVFFLFLLLILLVPNHTQMPREMKREGRWGRKRREKGREGEASMNRASWVMDKGCVCACLCACAGLCWLEMSCGETWEASCLCRSAKQKEPSPHTPTFYISQLCISFHVEYPSFTLIHSCSHHHHCWCTLKRWKKK